jgi:hypothetical protein
VPERTIGLRSALGSVDKSAKSVIAGYNGAFDTPPALTTGITHTLETAVDKLGVKLAHGGSRFLLLTASACSVETRS